MAVDGPAHECPTSDPAQERTPPGPHPPSAASAPPAADRCRSASPPPPTGSTSPSSAGTAPASRSSSCPRRRRRRRSPRSRSTPGRTAPATTGTSASTGCRRAFCYGWRVDGPHGAGAPVRPDRAAARPGGRRCSRTAAVWAGTCEVDPQRTSRRSLYYRGPRYDWEDDAPPLTPARRLRSSTSCTSAASPATRRRASRHPGTFRGLVEKIPYLKWLGVTAVELMPMFEFDECDCPFTNPETGEKLVNFWGYNPIAFAAPEGGLRRDRRRSTARSASSATWSRRFHAAGIEVILDVVFNHTGEGDDRGRTYSLPRARQRALLPARRPDGHYLNFTGLRQHGELQPPGRPRPDHDVPALLGRRHARGRVPLRPRRRSSAATAAGNVMVEPPVVESIAEDGVLADTKLIAEPWDAAGLYQVGGFPFGRRWSEWNGQYRDDVRRFWRGDPGHGRRPRRRASAAARDLYQRSGRLPRHSVNFVTCHDGFTLWRPRQLQPEAQRGQRRGQPRRRATTTTRGTAASRATTDDPEVLALRRPAGEEPDGHADAVARACR